MIIYRELPVEEKNRLAQEFIEQYAREKLFTSINRDV